MQEKNRKKKRFMFIIRRKKYKSLDSRVIEIVQLAR